MIRALLLTVPFIFVSASLSVFASSAHAADANKCDWLKEAFSDKVSASCQADMESLTKNEQDKIEARRMFKEWTPVPKDYEIMAEDGFFQISSPSEDYVFQAQWLSMEPAIAIIDGNLVVDDSKDPSMFRRIDRMFKKVQSATDTASAIQMFLFSNEAYAAVDKSVMERQQFATYSIAGMTRGTASEVLSRADSNVRGSLLPATGPLGSYITADSVSCDAKNQLKGVDQTILNGKKVNIRPVEGKPDEYIVRNWVNGKDIKVVLHPKGDVPKELMVKHTYKNPKTGKKKTIVVAGRPCQERYSAALEPTCKALWNEYAAGEGHDDAKKYLASFAAAHSGQEPKFGQDVKCIDIYKGKDADAGKKRVDCLNYFSGRMGKSYIEGTAKFFYCDDNKGCNTPVGDDANLLKDQNPEIADKAKPADREIVRGGLNYYVEALKNAHLDPEQYCGFETRRQILIVGSKDAKCTFPNDLYVKDKPKFEALKNAFDQVQHPKETEVKIAKGNLRQAVEERILGMKMLSEACKNPALAKLMSEKYRMNVQSGKDAAAPKTVK